MSDITTAIQSVLADVSVDKNGVVYLTRNALTSILQLHHSNLNRGRIPSKLAKKLTDIGFQYREREVIPDTAVAAIIEYYAFDAQKTSEIARLLYRAFAAVGIRSYFQQAKGWEPNSQTNQPTVHEMLEGFVTAYQNLKAYTKDKPGLSSVVKYALDNGDNCLPGMMTLSEILGERWNNLTGGQKCALGRMVSDTYKSTYLDDAPIVWQPVKEKSGKVVNRKFKIYPTDFVPQIESCYAQLAK